MQIPKTKKTAAAVAAVFTLVLIIGKSDSTQANSHLAEPMNLLDMDIKKLPPAEMEFFNAKTTTQACQKLSKWKKSKIELFLSRQEDMERVDTVSKKFLDHQDGLLKDLHKKFQKGSALQAKLQGLFSKIKNNNLRKISLVDHFPSAQRGFYTQQVLPVRQEMNEFLDKYLDNRFSGWFKEWSLDKDSVSNGHYPYVAMADKIALSRDSKVHQRIVESHLARIIENSDNGHFKHLVTLEIQNKTAKIRICTDRKYWELEGTKVQRPIEEQGLHQKVRNLCSEVDLMTGELSSDTGGALELNIENYHQVERDLARRCWQSIS